MILSIIPEEDQNSKNMIIIYPNPVESEAVVESVVDGFMNIYDITGRKVKEMEIQKRVAQEALAIAPDLPAALTQMGLFAYKDGNYREAMTYYSRALNRPASLFYYRALIGMGDASLSLGEIDKAVDYYRQA